MPPQTIAITAAEPSGDLQGAALARALRRRNPEIRLLGVGCGRMREAGVEMIAESALWSTIGPSEAFGRLPALILAYCRLRDELVRARPDLTVVIDAPAIHMRLAGHLRRKGLRTLYYFPPSAWSPNPHRARQIHRRVDAVVPAFRFNARVYEKAGLPAAFFGHPMVDLFTPPLAADQARERLGLPAGRYVALLPGSRTQEVRLLLPLLMEAARRLRKRHPDLRFLLPTATEAIERRIRGLLGPSPEWLTICSGQAREAMAASRVVLMASGSASLEAALLGVPVVLFYRLAPFDHGLVRVLRALGLFTMTRFTLPNLVLDEDVLPELFQDEVSAERLEREALPLLEEGPERRRLLAHFERLRRELGEPGVVPRVAAFVDLVSQGMLTVEALRRLEQEEGVPGGGSLLDHSQLTR